MPTPVKHRLAASLVLVIVLAVVLFTAVLALAATQQESIAEHADVLMKVMAGLLSLNAMFLTGFVAWLIGNQKELFTRIGHVETRVETLKAVCEERHE